MYGGTISGEYIEVVENKKIEMKWKMKDWKEYSNVVVTFEEGDDEVTV
eukprot:CAMPEP_0170557204 /NCGR_PEP_ID=MMETSP0211-20121228/19531_1 /TAXON_ID=311385 /ORGANISM="Pseudokeronopsis sp., Strain OXSARD2" /LENGTH=47 /DNA_ID= /DNA_START= /DNA_END= /DNA_ORIENTATION=